VSEVRHTGCRAPRRRATAGPWRYGPLGDRPPGTRHSARWTVRVQIWERSCDRPSWIVFSAEPDRHVFLAKPLGVVIPTGNCLEAPPPPPSARVLAAGGVLQLKQRTRRFGGSSLPPLALDDAVDVWPRNRRLPQLSEADSLEVCR
jgi:hypothetical protein